MLKQVSPTARQQHVGHEEPASDSAPTPPPTTPVVLLFSRRASCKQLPISADSINSIVATRPSSDKSEVGKPRTASADNSAWKSAVAGNTKINKEKVEVRDTAPENINTYRTGRLSTSAQPPDPKVVKKPSLPLLGRCVGGSKHKKRLAFVTRVLILVFLLIQGKSHEASRRTEHLQQMSKGNRRQTESVNIYHDT